MKPSRRVEKPVSPVLRPTAVFLWAAAAVVVTVGLIAFLARLSNGADPQRLAGLLDIVRIGLTAGAGTGGLFALWLATRRQRSAELTLALQREVSETTVVDSTERRITEQYNAAVEQLGHEKAAVRLGAVYSLERLAQEHVGHRQTVVDVLCSYLRLPYEPPADRVRRATSGTEPSLQAAAEFAELEVRYAIQHVFWAHLGDPEQRHVGEKRWPDIDLNLSRTTLVDPVLRQLAVSSFDCEDTVMYGTADFHGLRVADTSLVSGRFHDEVIFTEATFATDFALIGCLFEAGVDLSGISVQRIFTMNRCRFGGEVNLSGHSLKSLLATDCRFGYNLVLRGGTIKTTMLILNSDIDGSFVAENLDLIMGLVSNCSVRTPPEPHGKIVFTDDTQARDTFLRDVIAQFDIELDVDGTRLSPVGGDASAEAGAPMPKQ